MGRKSLERRQFGTIGFSRSKTVHCLPGVTAFCISNAIIDTKCRTPSADVYEAYLQWFPSFIDGSQKATRRVFTSAVIEIMDTNGFSVTYGPSWYRGKTVRCFTGLKLNPQPERPADGPLAVAYDLLNQSASRRADDPAYAREIVSVCSLLPSYLALQWSKNAVRMVLDDYVDAYPELETIKSLL